MPRTVHIIGAGLAGLSAAVRLIGQGMGKSEHVRVYEATAQAGGRCRSYHDLTIGMTIDNGNHLLLSGNRAALSYLDAIGARHLLIGPGEASVPFVDLKSGERWTLRANDGALAWWIFDKRRRVPGTSALSYLSLLNLLRPSDDVKIGDIMKCEGALYDRLTGPFLLAALNIEPPEGSAALASAVVTETLLAGGQNYHPLIAREGLSTAFVDPGLEYIAKNGGTVAFERQLRGFAFDKDRVSALDFGDETVTLAPGDAVVLAVPPWAASALVPGLETPTAFRAIVNAHFKIEPPAGVPPITGVVGGIVEWLFTFQGRLSVTISAADRLLNLPREELAAQIWHDVARIAGIAEPLPPWQIVRERRATFAATPQENAKRPGAATRFSNLALAGDWTATGLPATIEGAIRSGQRAADLIAGKA
jgi:squalene-associated FAD-dependent desaturase